MAEFLTIHMGEPDDLFSRIKRFLAKLGIIRTVNLVALIAIVVALPLTLLVASREQEIRQRAAEPTTPGIQKPVSRSVPGDILLKFKPGVSQKIRTAIMKQYGLTQQDKIPQIDVLVIKVPERAQGKVIEALSHNPHIQYAEPNHISQVQVTPNDPLYAPSQWNLQKIGMPAAWEITKGSTSVPVAVVDTGISSGNTDLQGKMRQGASFVNYTQSTDDDHGHGTTVSGIIGAVTDNSTGVAGMGWNTQVMPLKACDSTGSCLDSHVAAAVVYAADHGIRAVNLSLGSYDPLQSVQDAVNYAWSKGVIVVAASGNSGYGSVMYPAAGHNVIAVGGSDGSDSLANFSNYGPGVDIVAPGLGIYSTEKSGTYASHAGTSYATSHVTALAALLFAAKPALTNHQVVSLIVTTASKTGSYAGAPVPYSDTTTNNCGGWNQYFGCGRIDAAKALQAARGTTLTSDATPPTVHITAPSNGTTVSDTVSVTIAASDNVGVTKGELLVNGGVYASTLTSPYTFMWDTTEVSNGFHTLTARVYDGAGNVGTATAVTVNVTNTLVDTTAPTVTITAPSAGMTVAAHVSITADATDNVGVSSLSFFVDGHYVDQDLSAPYTIDWDTTQFPNGTHTVTAIAFDGANNSETSQAVPVSVNNTVPSPTPTPSPTFIPTLTPEPALRTSVPTPTTVFPPAGGSDTQAPSVTITNPQSGAVVAKNASITLSASASDNVRVARVDFLVNGSVRCTDTEAPYSCLWKATGKTGTAYTLTARAVDISNNTSSSSIVVSTR